MRSRASHTPTRPPMTDVVRMKHTPKGAVRAVALVFHGGSEGAGTKAVGEWSPSYRRAAYLHWCVKNRLADQGIALWLTRFRFDNWAYNGAAPGSTQVDDSEAAIEQASIDYPGVPVVLIGHSMGARVAVRVAAQAHVAGVIGLAPWFPAEEAVDTLTDRHLAVAVNPGDPHATAAEATAYCARAAARAISVEYQEIGSESLGRRARGYVGHGMVTNPSQWHRFITSQAGRMIYNRDERHHPYGP